ncbi:MAG: hypothetical protein RSC29_02075, partial [Oscillospiraceae bacterium]
HKAVISAIIMGGIDPVFIDADFDEVHGIYCGINNNSLLNILSENEDVVGAIITSPTYYGICSDIKAIADSLHKAGKFLIVDEAHGSHFVFNEKLPNTALELGADVCIQSLHKTLPALGQSSLLHIGKTDLVDINSIENHLRLLHTTSPSYMIMASMDEAILKMQQDTKNFEKLIDLVINLKTKIDVVGKLKCLKSNDFQNQYDILRLVVNFENIGISGYDACEVLNRVYGIYPELADNKNVVFIITIGNTKKDIDSLETALEEMTITDFEPKTIKPQMKLPSINLCFSPHRAWNSESETVRIQDANDKICAEIVASCPPGCAILVPGQMIDADTIAYITEQTAIKYVKTII